MTKIELAQQIGSILTQLDTILSTPGIDDAQWQILYALRKHLDDQQREIIKADIQESDSAYQGITDQLKKASDQLNDTINDLTKVSKVIGIISQIATYADKILDKVA